ncbi:MAG: porphobilinogen synthase [Candidatus Sericytochromatia bacterium]|uniref:Delta-aminolevulinic acid dehydratase n=1 Tax=Candidatus Tanganyikabacteria bacterium TaxID=2961651 RepID=A0A937X5J8_9BACT|nr:porphobilinogen synthase [Candidatus Tanganyikabacteria bacterium]
MSTTTRGPHLPEAGQFPTQRPRRLRKTDTLRRLVRETELDPGDWIYPYFVVPGHGVRNDVGSMPGVSQLSVDNLVRDAAQVAELGVGGVILFGLPPGKDAAGSGAYDENGVVQVATRALKREYPDLLVVCDVCLCEYTDHGHCGVVRGEEIQNDPTLELLARMSVSCAAAGADVIAPSDMMDGRVGAIRQALDAAGFADLAIMAYSAKFASGFYGPFREAADSAPQFGDRRSYQMDPANAREALKEVALDIVEGADIVMVKPALAYLDLIWRVKQATDRPVAAYNVSGEYAMIKAAARNGWIDERRVTLETLTGMKRAGADILLTYHALEAARWLREG